ncbi:hypothetical protein DAETH_39420 (plasmid) [Deinococcus aetherius]|uniref:Uncharacterized protein n=1 Tax=Deinococcus aetherius TaxID=200252 RepID=A0ABM8AJV1_9DEIO|nr:hypothetical protein [Deinococcus aetherius]BDP43973.1 hypothetical protein DAETH_39420 [Deinococcus aetherius]
MTTTRTARRLLTLALAAALAGPALAHQGHGHAAQPVVQLQGQDYRFVTPTNVTTGWTTLEFRNTGKEPHHMQLVRLPAGMTQEGFLAGLKENEGAALASVEMVGGVGLLLPGQAQQVTINLTEPGTYLALCFVPDAKGVPHLALGMVNAFQVTRGADTQAQPPRADLKVRLVDFGFELPKGVTITEGPQVWAVENAGPEGHEMLVFKLAPGKTMEDVSAYLAKPEGPMPVIPAGGAQAVTKGRTSYVRLDLTPGDYLLLCGIPSPAHQGAPHAALGMVRPFKVVARTAQK